MVAAPPEPATRVPLWRNRDFILLWSGQIVSTLGTRITSIAFPLLVLGLTGSPAKAGLVASAQTIPYALVHLPAGVLVDRWDRKRIMLVSDAVRALAFGSLVLALVLDRVTLAQILVVAVVEGTLFVFFQLAESSALPQLVPHEQLGAALAQNQAREQGAELAGAPLGGVLFSVGRVVPFLADAISYAVSFLTLLAIRPPFQEAREPRWTTLRAEIGEGVRWYWQQPFLRTLIAVVGATNIVYNALYLVLIVRARNLGASPFIVGAMFAFAGGGAILGALLAPGVQRHVSAKLVLLGSLWLWGTGMAVLVPLPNAVALGVVIGLLAVAGPIFNVVLGSYRYALAPDRLLGRTASVARLVAWGTIPLGPLVAGFLVEAIGAAATLVVLATGMLLVAAAATVSPSVRSAPDLSELLAARA